MALEKVSTQDFMDFIRYKDVVYLYENGVTDIKSGSVVIAREIPVPGYNGILSSYDYYIDQSTSNAVKPNKQEESVSSINYTLPSMS